MNSLHTSLPQKTPVRGVALRPLEETRRDAAMLATATTVAIQHRRASLFVRSMEALRKAARAGNGSVLQGVVFVMMLLAMMNTAWSQQTYFWVGGANNDWGKPANWSLSSGGMGGAGVPGSNYGSAQDVAIFDANSGANIVITRGFPTGMPGVGQIRLINSLSSGPQVTFGGAAATAATIRVGGVVGSTNPPLFVGSLCRLFVDQNITLETSGVGGAMNTASIFGDLSIRIGGTVVNSFASRFRIEEGGSLRMSGGTFSNTAGAMGAVLYALTGSRGSLVYDRNDNTPVTIPAPNDNIEVPDGATTLLGNVVVRRPLGSVTTFTDGQNWLSGGTLIVDGCPLTLPNNFYMELSASRMLNNGSIFAYSLGMNNSLVYRDIMAGATQAPLNPTTSDLAFGTNPSGAIINGQFLNRLVNQIPLLNLTINSDLNIIGGGSGLELGAPGNAGGQLTIPASRTLTLRSGAMHQIDAMMNTGRIIVNGTLAIATGATLTNNNTNINSPLAGIVVNAGGRIQLNGTGNILGQANGTFYTGLTATLEYFDRDATMLSPFAPGGLANYTAPVTRNVNISELPADMHGGVTVHRRQPSDMLNDITTVALQGNTVMRGPLVLTNGGLGLSGRQLIIQNTITTSLGGFLAGTDVAGTSALVYKSAVNGTIAVTTSTVGGHGRFFNYIEVGGAGNLAFTNGQNVVIDGSMADATYGLAGASNYNGQLRFTGAGNLVLNSSEITFQGMGAANTVPAAQGGHIPVTTGTIGAIVGDGGSRLIFTSNAIRSFPRFAAGGQQLLELRLTGDGNTPGNMPMTVLTDYMVSLRTPLQTSIVTIQNNAVLQLGNAANLTVLNPPDLITASNVPNPLGNFIDASQGGSLQLRGYLTVGDVLIPVGVSFVDAGGAVIASGYRPITLSNSITTMPGGNFTVSVTSAIVNLVPAIPTLVNNSMRGQWTVSSGTGVNGTGAKLQVGWTSTAYNPANGSGDEPMAFNTTLAGPMGTTLTTIRRWTGSTYTNVLPTNPVNGGVLADPRSLQATYTGALNNTIFIVSNELFPIYWVGGSPVAGDWGVAANWASTSGGAAGSANPPGVNDWAVFDRNQAPRITNNIPASIQQMSVIEGAHVTLAPGNLPTNLSISRNQINDNLYIGPGSRLSIGTGTFPMTVTIPDNGAANGPNTAVFGTLAILPNGTYNHADAMSTILIANGGTLLIGTQTASSLPTVMTGFQKNAGTVLQYGENQNSVSPYLIGAPAEQNATLRYEDTNGGIDIRQPGVATGELPAATLPGNLVINKTVAGSVFGIAGNYTVTSSATLQAGILDLTQVFMGGGGFELTVGTAPNPISNPPGSRTLKITGTLPNTGIQGNMNSILNLNGPGTADLQFVPGGETLNTLLLNDASNAAPNAALTAVLKSNLTITNAFTMTNVRNAVAKDHGFIVNAPHTLRVNMGGTVTAGRMLVHGTLALPTAAPTMALPATIAEGGIDIATTGTLNIINDGVVVGTPMVNPVRYLNIASKLLYSAEGAGFAVKPTTNMEFPQIFPGSLVINKNASVATTTNAVQLDECKVITGGTVQLIIGDLYLNGQMFKIGSSAMPLPAVPDLLNNTISTTARLLQGGGRIWGGNMVDPSSFVYNSTHNANLWLGNLNGSTHEGRFLNKIEVNGPSTLTLSTHAVVTIDGTAGSPACDATYPGLVRLNNSTGNLALNGSSLQLTGADAATGGGVLTWSTSGSIVGDALPGTSIRITSYREFNLKMAPGAGASLRKFGLEPAAIVPAVGMPQVNLISSMTTDELGVTRNIVSLGGAGVVLTVTGTGTNSTTGNMMAGEAAFGLNNNNFIHTSLGSLRLTVLNNTTRMFPIGSTNNTATFIRPAPLTITNGGGGADNYTVGVKQNLDFQNAVYPDRVNLQWTIVKGAPSAINQTVQFGWHTEHETGGVPGFLRQNSFAAQWNGSNYTQLPATLSSPIDVSTPPGMEWSHTMPFTAVTMSASNPFVVIAPPRATILAADSLSPNGSGGFNPSTPNGFASPAAGNLTITSGTPFKLRISAFNGLNQRSPVTVITSVLANLHALPGGTAIFNTTGTGSVIDGPIILNPTLPAPANPISSTTADLVFDWLNPGNMASTQATLVLWAGVGSDLVSMPLTITVLAPPLRASTIAYSRDQNTSTSTVGFNGGGLGQFNITSGVGFPIKFGFFSHSNFLAATTANTQMLLSITPITPGAIFDVSPTVPLSSPPVAINPITVNVGQNGGEWQVGTLPAIVNWSNSVAMGGGVAQAVLTLSAVISGDHPQMRSTSVVISVGTGATVPVKLGYSINHGDIAAEALAYSGVNNGNYTQATNTPIISGIPFPLNFASFAQNGMVVRPAMPTQVQITAAEAVTPGAVFSVSDAGPVTIASTNGIASLMPRVTWVNPGTSSGYGQVKLRLSVVNGSMLEATEVTISVFTTGTVPVVIAMSHVSTNGTQGVYNNTLPYGSGGTAQPIPIPSGIPFFIDYGFYNAWGLPAATYPANGNFVVEMVAPFPALGAGESITIDGNPITSLPFAVTQGRISNLVLNWRGRTGVSPTTVDVTLRLRADFTGIPLKPPVAPDIHPFGPVTTVTIRLSSSSSVPVFLGLSQVSSTSSVGVNSGNPIISGQAFNVDAGLYDINGALTPSLTNVSANLSVSTPPGLTGIFNISGNVSGVFVNQAGIRYNNVVINWTNPPSGGATTLVRLTISTTAGAGPILSTFADITIAAGDVFPRITNISPAAGGPGTQVQITGVNFTGVNAVSFNGIPAASFIVQGDGLIIATAPPGVSTGPITVSRPAAGAIPMGSGTSPTPFTVGAAAAISAISPAAGGTGTRVVITGTNLGGATFVTVAGLDTRIEENTPTSVVVVITGSSPTSITGPVVVGTGTGGVVTSSQLFTYNLPPIVASVTPNSAVVNGQDIPIIIRGQNFNFPLMPSTASQLEQQSGVYFTINDSPQAISPALKISLQSITPTEIRATIPGSLNNMAGQRFVYVQNVDGQYVFIPFQLTPAAAPVITNITPSVTTASGVAFTAVITGANFFGQAGTTVTAAGTGGQTIPLLFRAVSPTQLNITIPESLNQVAQMLNIRVQNSDGQFTNTQLIIQDPGRPFITSVTPPRAVVGDSGITVSINGGNFFLNAIVTLGNTDLQVLSRSTTNIVAFIPGSLLTTFGNPTLTVRNGLNGFAAVAFFPIGYAPPTITSIVTASGPNPGQTVTAATVFPFRLAINGAGFRIGVTVTFNGTNVPIVSTSPTQVVVAIPSGLNGTPGVYPVIISNADGQNAQGLFTIGTANGPVITRISPTQEIAAGLPFVLTIEGQNFSVNAQGQPLAGTQVLFNGQSLAILQASPTRIVAQVPAGVNNQEGTAQVQVVNSDLQRASFPMTILCGQCPIVRSFTPTTVRPTNNYGHNVTFTLNGSNFRPGAVVTVGGAPLMIVSISDSVIVAVAPPGFFFGNGEIVVTNLDGRRFTTGGLTVNVRDISTVPLTGRAYPNPVEDMLTVETDVPKPSLVRIRISDMLGRTLTSLEQQVGTGRFTRQLDVSSLPAGVYIFEMTDGERRFTEKLIKR